MPSVALVPAIALLAGVCAGIAWEQPMPDAPLLVAGLWIAVVAAWIARRDRIVVAVTLLAYAVAGATLGGGAAANALAPPIRVLLEEEFGGFALGDTNPAGPHEALTIRGRLLEDAGRRDFGVSVRVDLHAVAIRGAPRPVSGGVRLAIGGESAIAHAHEWRAGRVVEAPVTFRRPARYLNDGVPDFERDLALDGVALNATVKSGLLVQVVDDGSAFEEAAAEVRARVRARISRRVGVHDPLAAAVVTAILIGDRTGLPEDVRTRLQAAGTYHVIAISGGNIAILAALIAALFLITGMTGRLSAAAIIAGLLAYAAVVDAGPSVWRATATAVAYLAARLLDHRSPPWNAMAVSAAVLACTAPLDVRDAGFALTFGATAAILEAARRMRPRTREARQAGIGGWRSWLLASVVASAAAEIVLLPIAASVFSRVTCAGLVLNLLAVPLMTVAQVAGLAVVAADGLEWVAALAGLTAAAAAKGLLESARLVDVAPWLAIRVPAPSAITVALYYIGLGGALWIPHCRLFSRSLLATSALAILTAATPAVRPQMALGLRLTVFDVGQGDAMLLQTPGGRAVMVDTGGMGFDGGAFDVGGRVLAPALWARGVRRLSVLALTHGDPDHMGGAAALLRDFAPAAIWQGIPVPRHATLRDLLALARRSGIPVVQQHAGARLDMDGVSIRVLHPPEPDWERPRVRNDDSLVLEIRHGDVAMLLTGDISQEIERAIVPMLAPARVRILKVAHHGSRTSTSRDLLDAWKPQIAVISCGRGNRFGHPAPEVLTRLESSGVRVYRTDRDGQITIVSDGATADVRTFVTATKNTK